MYTVTVYAKPLGGIAGCTRVYPDILQAVDKVFRNAKGSVLHDFVVTHIGDRVVSLIISDADRTAEAAAVVDSAYAVGEEIAKSRKLFINPSPASSLSLTFAEREAEAFVLFLAGSADADLWNGLLPAGENQASSAASLMLCRTEGEFCTTAELLETFADESVSARGISPVSLCDSAIVRTKVTPVVALGFSLGNGILTGPLDLFDTPLFDAPRLRASQQ